VVHLDLRGGAVHRPLGDVALDRRRHRLREVVTVQQRAVPHHVVEIAVAVLVDDVGAVTALDEERVRLCRPDGGVDPTREYGEATVVEIARLLV